MLMQDVQVGIVVDIERKQIQSARRYKVLEDRKRSQSLPKEVVVEWI